MWEPSPDQPAPSDREAAAPPPDIADALLRMGLCRPGEAHVFHPLAGGVSSDIWRVECGGRRFCVKQALARLKVEADWQAPVSRNASEAAWLRTVAGFLPEAVPRLLGEDSAAGLFAMEWLEPERHPVWKAQLLAGRVDAAFAAAVADRLVRIHAATAGNADVARHFVTDHIFEPIRIEPYLRATAARHPDLADVLSGIAETTARTKLALVHGDISPKNILAGPRGPVFLDAECAWYGDPAFDLVFCLNHLLLKCIPRPDRAEDLLIAFDVLAGTYRAGITWEPREALEARAAWLLPALFLARVDGKSPAEYITREDDRERVRRTARLLLANPVARLSEVAAAWREELP